MRWVEANWSGPARHGERDNVKRNERNQERASKCWSQRPRTAQGRRRRVHFPRGDSALIGPYEDRNEMSNRRMRNRQHSEQNTGRSRTGREGEGRHRQADAEVANASRESQTPCRTHGPPMSQCPHGHGCVRSKSMLLTLLDFYCLYFNYSISTLSDSYVYTRGLPGKGNANAGRLQSSSLALHLLMAPRSTKSVHKSS